MTTRLKVSARELEQLRALCTASAPNEGGAFALAGFAENDSGRTLLVRRVIPIPESEFRAQEAYFLEVSPRAISGLGSLCKANGLTAILCHSHVADIDYSPTDDFGEARVVRALRGIVPAGVPIGSLLFLPEGRVRGRVWYDAAVAETLSEVVSVGHRLARHPIADEVYVMERPEELFDREVRAFGEAGHALVRTARVAVVGVSGTGTPVAEQLARLGVSDFVLIDPKTFRGPNLSRMYGTYEEDVGLEEPKVELLARHLKRIRGEIRVEAVQASVVEDRAARRLLHCDCIFLCTDDHWGRSVVNQIAYQYLIPTFNLGVEITSAKGNVSAAVGRVDVLRPGTPCLWCKQFLSSGRIAAESMPCEERTARAQEGYVEGVETAAPAVITLNSSIASQASSLFLHLMTGFMGEFGDVARIHYDALLGTMRRGKTALVEDCVCSRQVGFGDLKALATITQQWVGTE